MRDNTISLLMMTGGRQKRRTHRRSRVIGRAPGRREGESARPQQEQGPSNGTKPHG